ncbi:MAG: serine/threonine-protein kinase [Sandaracinaceae bacterium]
MPSSLETVAGRYRLLRELGRGGTATVYAAMDEASGDEVALKLIHVDDDGLHRARLFREARLLKSLQHPGVVRLLDCGGLPDGRAYLVMERLKGQTLRDRMDGCFWLPLEEVKALASSLFSALSAVHQLGVVHRDVKPSNVFLGADGRVSLFDFGIGRDLGDPGSRLTAPGVVMGTVAYMAPERMFGVDGGPMADVYGVAATLYEALTGRTVYGDLDGHVASMLAAMARGATPILELRPAVCPALASGVMQALHLSPSERPENCRDLAALCSGRAAA